MITVSVMKGLRARFKDWQIVLLERSKKNERRKNQENIITNFITSLKAKFDSSVFHQ